MFTKLNTNWSAQMCDLGRSIRMIRQAQSLSMTNVAKAASISTAFMSLIESGEKEPSLSVVRRIAEALGVPSDVLLILSQPQRGSLQTKDRGSKRLTESIEKLLEAENMLKESLGKGGKTSAAE